MLPNVYTFISGTAAVQQVHNNCSVYLSLLLYIAYGYIIVYWISYEIFSAALGDGPSRDRREEESICRECEKNHDRNIETIYYDKIENWSQIIKYRNLISITRIFFLSLEWCFLVLFGVSI